MTNEQLIQLLENLKTGLSNNEIRSQEKLERDIESKRFYETEVQKYQDLIDSTTQTVEETRALIANGEAEKEILNKEITRWQSIYESELEKNSAEIISDAERSVHARNVSNLKTAIAANEARIELIDNAPSYLALREAELADYQSKLDSASEYLTRFNSIINSSLSSSTLVAEIDGMINGLTNGTLTQENIKTNLENYLAVELSNLDDMTRVEKIENIDRLSAGLDVEIANLSTKLSDESNYSSSIFEDAQFKQNIKNLEIDLNNANLNLVAAIASSSDNVDNLRAVVQNIEDKIAYYKDKLENPVRQSELTNDRNRLERLKANLASLQETKSNLDFDVREAIEVITSGIGSQVIAPAQQEPTPVAPEPAQQEPTPVAPEPAHQEPTPVAPAPAQQEPTPVAPTPAPQEPTPAAPEPASQEQKPEEGNELPLGVAMAENNEPKPQAPTRSTKNVDAFTDGSALDRLENEGVYMPSALGLNSSVNEPQENKPQKVTSIKDAPAFLKNKAKGVLAYFSNRWKKVKDHFAKYWIGYAAAATAVICGYFGFRNGSVDNQFDPNQADDLNQAKTESNAEDMSFSKTDIVDMVDDAIAEQDFQDVIDSTIQTALDYSSDFSHLTDEELGKMIIRGDFGNGDERRAALGDDYARGQSWVDANWGGKTPQAEVVGDVTPSIPNDATVGWVYETPSDQLPEGAISQKTEIVDDNRPNYPQPSDQVVHEDPNPDTSLQEGETITGGEVLDETKEEVDKDVPTEGESVTGGEVLDETTEVVDDHVVLPDTEQNENVAGGDIVNESEDKVEDNVVLPDAEQNATVAEDNKEANKEVEVLPGETFVTPDGENVENTGKETVVIPGEEISSETTVVEDEIPDISAFIEALGQTNDAYDNMNNEMSMGGR